MDKRGHWSPNTTDGQVCFALLAFALATVVEGSCFRQSTHPLSKAPGAL